MSCGDHQIDSYCDDIEVAGAYENQMLYRACLRDAPRHDDVRKTMGKLIAVGRIYAASPQRGAGAAGQRDDFWEMLARKLKTQNLDTRLEQFTQSLEFGIHTLKAVVDCHGELVGWIHSATLELAPEGNPRRHWSFASKYLYFHRPNLFPMMDSFATAGLIKRSGSISYEAFCCELVRSLSDGNQQTLRSIDASLVRAGRELVLKRSM